MSDMQTRPRIIVENVTKEFRKRATRSFKDTFIALVTGKETKGAQFRALDDISFMIHEGESVAVMGLNGSGKSTTLKLVSGVLEPDAGTVLTRGRVAGLIEVGAGFHPDPRNTAVGLSIVIETAATAGGSLEVGGSDLGGVRAVLRLPVIRTRPGQAA